MIRRKIWFSPLLVWRDVRVVEGAALEKRYSVYGVEGSNPSLSARVLRVTFLFNGS
ncbi:MAG: hypothetical protein UT55_C0047G0006 [Candidatus Peregrinibacteria bacterium GW2011_GWE2_39_6]|nr:MAG: hypothetical protein UT36_C0001G0091 [Candidatus Peregrinibacteria bacterium GW2011_GWF2_39_17]KKR25264.1 MAG: hypothetical protein UT55_C0047G0006 [Candidatus Peregrinibacteria bacterium GW2011_GWE2_39_6]